MRPPPAAEASNSALGDVRGLLGLEDPPAQHPVACARMGTISVRGLQGCQCKGEGEAHLLIDDADVVLDAARFQGVS